MTKSNNRNGRWLGFWVTLLIAFGGMHLVWTSSHSWYWFIPLFMPFAAFLQMESEKSDPIGYKNPVSSWRGKLARALGFWSAGIVAFIGIYGMAESSVAWFWFSPLLIPFFILLPGRMREWELQDAEKKRSKEERQLDGGRMPIRKILKWIFWLALIGLVWYFGSYYLWLAILG